MTKLHIFHYSVTSDGMTIYRDGKKVYAIPPDRLYGVMVDIAKVLANASSMAKRSGGMSWSHQRLIDDLTALYGCIEPDGPAAKVLSDAITLVENYNE